MPLVSTVLPKEVCSGRGVLDSSMGGFEMNSFPSRMYRSGPLMKNQLCSVPPWHGFSHEFRTKGMHVAYDWTEEEVANFRFPIAKGEKDLSSLTTSFARFVRSSVLCLRRVALQYIFCRLLQNRQMTTNGFHMAFTPFR